MVNDTQQQQQRKTDWCATTIEYSYKWALLNNEYLMLLRLLIIVWFINCKLDMMIHSNEQ